MPYSSLSHSGFDGLGLTELEIKKMVRHVRRYHLASIQDANPMIAFLHNAYAVGIMDMLRELANDDEIDLAAETDIKELRKEVLDMQDKMERKAIKIVRKIGLDKAMKAMKDD